MPINKAMFAALQPGAARIAEGVQSSGNEERQTKLKAFLAPQVARAEQAAKNEESLNILKNPQLQDLVNQGGSVKAGDIALGADPMARLMNQGPHEAQAFLKNAQGAYKGINDQLDAGQATLESLNQKNAASDKLALINEAKLAAGSGGSRAIKSIMDSLTGGRTAGMDYQTAVNYLNNTPNVPVMQDSQRNAIRESVFNRLPQIEQMHNQASNQLLQQGPAVAPHADYNTIVKSFVTPAQQKLEKLKGMQSDYQGKMAQMPQPQSQVSQPATADSNQSVFDKLSGFFGKKQKPQAPAQPQVPGAGGFDPDAYLKGQ